MITWPRTLDILAHTTRQQLNTLTFDTSPRPVTIGAGTYYGRVVESVGAFRRGGVRSHSLRSIYFGVCMIEELLDSELVPYLNSVEWESTVEALSPDT